MRASHGHVLSLLLGLSSLGALSACSGGGGASDAATSEDASSDAVTSGDASSDATTSGDASGDASVACDDSMNMCAGSTWIACIEGVLESEPCAYGCAEGGCNDTCEDPSVVIDHDVGPEGIDHAGSVSWQSFQVADTGVLTALELRPNLYMPDETFTLTLSVYSGEGTSGELVAQEQYTRPSVGAAPWDTFDFTTPIPLQAGETYSFRLEGANSIFYSQSDTYPDGRASVAGYDLLFKAHFRVCH